MCLGKFVTHRRHVRQANTCMLQRAAPNSQRNDGRTSAVKDDTAPIGKRNVDNNCMKQDRTNGAYGKRRMTINSRE